MRISQQLTKTLREVPLDRAPGGCYTGHSR